MVDIAAPFAGSTKHDILNWMQSNRFQLNADKTQLYMARNLETDSPNYFHLFRCGLDPKLSYLHQRYVISSLTQCVVRQVNAHTRVLVQVNDSQPQCSRADWPTERRHLSGNMAMRSAGRLQYNGFGIIE